MENLLGQRVLVATDKLRHCCGYRGTIRKTADGFALDIENGSNGEQVIEFNETAIAYKQNFLDIGDHETKRIQLKPEWHDGVVINVR